MVAKINMSVMWCYVCPVAAHFIFIIDSASLGKSQKKITRRSNTSAFRPPVFGSQNSMR